MGRYLYLFFLIFLWSMKLIGTVVYVNQDRRYALGFLIFIKQDVGCSESKAGSTLCKFKRFYCIYEYLGLLSGTEWVEQKQSHLLLISQVIFKSCKLIPVMIGSMIILGKKYTFPEVVACVFMSLGLIWFTLADSTIQPNFSVTGMQS